MQDQGTQQRLDDLIDLGSGFDLRSLPLPPISPRHHELQHAPASLVVDPCQETRFRKLALLALLHPQRLLYHHQLPSNPDANSHPIRKLSFQLLRWDSLREDGMLQTSIKHHSHNLRGATGLTEHSLLEGWHSGKGSKYLYLDIHFFNPLN